jgi:DNA-binding CsgD family transcriptional regulator
MDPVSPPLGPVAGILAVIAGLVGLDVLTDLAEGVKPEHALVEGLVLALAMVGLGWVLVHLRRDRARLAGEVRRLDADRARLDAAAARWREEAARAARSFADAMDVEFERWALTAAEREVAMLLLKGMSLKDIAAARGTAERTVRQQATTIYAKAGVAGRTELASYFLDALPSSSSSPDAVT